MILYTKIKILFCSKNKLILKYVWINVYFNEIIDYQHFVFDFLFKSFLTILSYK